MTLISATTSNVSSPTSDTFIVESGGILNILDGGTGSGLITVSSGGFVNVSAGGSTLDTIVSAGGLATVLAGGSATDTDVTSGGKESINGTDTSGTIGSGGSATVFAGGVTFNDLISATNGASGFTATSAVEILSGGTASGATVSGTGKLVVRDGGSAVNAIVEGTHFTAGSNGGLNVSAGGTASGTILNGGGTEFVSASGSAFDTMINNRGVEFVSAAGVETGAIVNFGGQLMISGGTVASGTVNANGIATVFGGGTASEITINGGTLDIKAGGGAPDAITFTGAGGALELEAAPAHGGAIVGMTATIDGFAVNGDTIDLAGLAYVAGGTATMAPGNGLRITEGGSTANLRFDAGQDFSNDTFLLNPDSSGGTMLTLGSTLPATGTFAYYVNGSETAGPMASLMRIEQMPGGSWSAPAVVTIDGVDTNGNSANPLIAAVDPSVSVLPNGQYLLTYDNFVQPGEPNNVYTAVSTDGINFTDPQIAFDNSAGATLFDPTVIQLADGSFLLATTVNSSAVDLYASADGRSYTPTGVSLPGLFSTQLELLPNGDIRLFSNGFNGITSDISTDGGQTWAAEPGFRLAGNYTNPTVLQTAPGQWEMIVNDLIPGDPGPGNPSNEQLVTATSTDGENFTVSNPSIALQASVPSLAANPPFIVVTNAEADVTSATSDGYLVGAGGLLNVDSGGSIANPTVAYDGVLAVASGGSVSGAIDFTTTSGTLQLNGPFNPGPLLPDATISGFVPGDTIGLFGVPSDAHADMDYSTNVLTVTEGGHQYELDFSTSDSFAGEYFHVVAGKVTDLILDSTPCYCPGTLILTPQGERRVEQLRIGDEIMVRSGAARAIKWIGRRSYSGRFVVGRKDILPIRIKAGALDADLPRRDLWISPHHAMYFEDEAGAGLLIEARDLVNGISIVQAEGVDKLEYVHVELETHDIIVAEGALSETFLDDDSRAMFHNADEYRAMYPDHVPQSPRYCAPRRTQGYEVEAVRRAIDARADLPTPDSTGGSALRGFVDIISADCIAGWAQNPDRPEAPVCLDIFAGGQLIGQVLANRYRADLARAGLGNGRHSFDFVPSGSFDLVSNAVEVRRSLDGAVLLPAAQSRPAAAAR